MAMLMHLTERSMFENCLQVFYYSVIPFQQEDSPEVLGRSQLMPKVLKFCRMIPNGRCIIICLELLCMAARRLSERDIVQEVVPFLQFLHQRSFDFPKSEPLKVETLTYRVMYNALETGVLKAANIPREWMDVMLEEFRTRDNPAVLSELTYFFCLVHTNCNVEHFQHLLEELITRAEKIMPEKIEMIAFIRENMTALRCV